MRRAQRPPYIMKNNRASPPCSLGGNRCGVRCPTHLCRRGLGGQLWKEARTHALRVGDARWMRFEEVPNWGLDWGQHSRGQGSEDDGICCRGPLAKEEGPLGHDRKHRTPVAYTRFYDVLVGVSKDALHPQNLSHLTAHHPRDQRADGRRDWIEGHARVPPSLLADEMCIENDKRIVLLEGALHQQRRRPLRWTQLRVGINALPVLEVGDDQRRIADTQACVFDEWQLAFGTLARVERVDGVVGYVCNAQPGLELAAER